MHFINIFNLKNCYKIHTSQTDVHQRNINQPLNKLFQVLPESRIISIKDYNEVVKEFFILFLVL